ncbi:hypothetical protein FGO68_gene1205 [Halteria grandinella]|uniref:Uncharacterized protein n=1 Tax=Halteria grandinella TaxID=5974 RepID=A0A8J8STX1_HALGN|nr:hypothetical protein FGO68_gene1205 [Halteria grandinella]
MCTLIKCNNSIIRSQLSMLIQRTSSQNVQVKSQRGICKTWMSTQNTRDSMRTWLISSNGSSNSSNR